MTDFIMGSDANWLINMNIVQTIYINDGSNSCFITIEYKQAEHKQKMYDRFGEYSNYDTICKIYNNLIQDINDNNIHVYTPRH